MNVIQKVKDFLFPSKQTLPPKQIQPLDVSFIFPYSNDKEIKRQEVWSNLQKGLLFEDTKVFVPWLTPFSELNKLAEQRRDRGDRTEWYLGKHEILDGYTCYVGVMKWIFIKDSNPFSQIEEWLGFDGEGNEKFMFLKNKLTDLLGEPSTIALEKFGEFDLGSVEWVNGSVRISLNGIEQFALKYRMYIGLADNINNNW